MHDLQTLGLSWNTYPERGSIKYVFDMVPAMHFQAAACELEEEAHLHQGTWHSLMKDEGTVAGAGKYSTQQFHTYLVVDPVVKGKPRGLDDGEFIEYVRGVSLKEVRCCVCTCHGTTEK